MRRITAVLILLLSLIFIQAGDALADVNVAQPSATLKTNSIENDNDYRVVVLKKYLEKMDSPLSDHSRAFIQAADRNSLDWRLVPAITGVESTFGKRIPPNSYNAYGWANGNYYFDSWEESIDVVSDTLKEKYVDRGATTIDEIARIYAPPSNTWSWKVKYFMNEIDTVPLTFTI
jgi:hypothetical protein